MPAATIPGENAFIDCISNRWVVGLGIPLAFIIMGALIKQTVDKTADKEEWLLGIELGLAGVTTTLIDMADWARHSVFGEKQQRASLYLLCEFLMFFGLMWLHSQVMQRRDPPDKMSWKQFWLLCIVGNFMGGVLLSCYLLFVKGLD